MSLSFAKKLDYHICKIDVGAFKTDNSKKNNYKIVIVLFKVDNKSRKFYLFEETFVLADISIKVAFKYISYFKLRQGQFQQFGAQLKIVYCRQNLSHY